MCITLCFAVKHFYSISKLQFLFMNTSSWRVCDSATVLSLHSPNPQTAIESLFERIGQRPKQFKKSGCCTLNINAPNSTQAWLNAINPKFGYPLSDYVPS